MTEPKQLPVWVCELFTLCDNDGVRWITEKARFELLKRMAGVLPRREVLRLKQKIIPVGETAGGRELHGHGRLVSFSGSQFTPDDVRAMLAESGRWPWENGAPAAPGVPSDLDEERLGVVRECVELHDSRLFWRVSPHSTIPAGSPVAGSALVDGRRVMMRGGCGFLTSDVAHALRFGDWPWRQAWD